MSGEVEDVQVPGCRLDRLIPGLIVTSPHSVLLKVDVEGFEESVLRGATSLLENAVWSRGIVVFNPCVIRRDGDDPIRLWNMLRQVPGVIIAKRGQKTEPFHLGSIWPATPPSMCDVLIGQGNAPEHEGTSG